MENCCIYIFKEVERRSEKSQTMALLSECESKLLSGQLGNTWKISHIGLLCTHLAKLTRFLV